MAALARLEVLLTKLGRWKDLEEVLEREVEVTHDATQQATLLASLGELRLGKLADREGAVQAFRDALERLPTHPKALAALRELLSDVELRREVVDILEPLAESRGDYAELASLYQVRVALESGGPERAMWWRRVAEIAESKLCDHQRALEALGHSLKEDPSVPDTAEALERVALAQNQPIAAARAMEAALDQQSGGGLVELSLRAAALYERAATPKNAYHAEAERLYRRVLDEEAENGRALEALENLYRTRSENDKLAKVLEQRGAVEMDAERRRAFYAEAARLFEGLGQAESATAAWQAIRENDQGNTEALDELARLLEQQGNTAQLVSVLEDRARVSDLKEERASLFFRIGELRRGPLQDSDGAAAAFREVLDISPADRSALAALAALEEARGDFSALEEVLLRRLSVAEGGRAGGRPAGPGPQRRGAPARHRAGDQLPAPDPGDRPRQPGRHRPAHPPARAERALVRPHRAVRAAGHPGGRRKDAGGGAGQPAGHRRHLEPAAGRQAERPRVGGQDPRPQGRPRRRAAGPGRPARAGRALGRGGRRAGAGGAGHRHRRATGPRCTSGAAGCSAAQGASDTEVEAALRAALDADPDHPEAARAAEERARKQGDSARLVKLLEQRLKHTPAGRAEGAAHRDRRPLPGAAGGARSGDGGADRAGRPGRRRRRRSRRSWPRRWRPRAAPTRRRRSCSTWPASWARPSRTGSWPACSGRWAGWPSAGGTTAAALQRFEAAYQLDPAQPAVVASLGRLALAEGNTEKARRYFRALLLQSFDEKAAGITKAEVYLALGRLHLAANEIPKARNLFERGLETDPKNADLRQALASLPR